MSWLMKLADNTDPGSLASRMRARRFRLFRDLLSTVPGRVRVLDVGGCVAFWQMMGGAGSLDVTILNTEPQQGAAGYHFVVGDARSLDYPDHAFDVVFSNSTIEHVGAWSDQRAAAAEIRRVGRRYFVQTPNRYFPIEPHFLMPGFQFLPERVRAGLHYRWRLGWMDRAVSRAAALATVREIRLLNASEMRDLFPGCTLYRERLLGVTKSLVAYGGF